MPYFVVIFRKFMWFLVFCIMFSIFILGKLNFAVILSERWVAKNKVSLLHYSYWRNRQGHFFIILNFEWFFSKSPHCLCLKILTTNTPLLGKKKYGVMKHFLKLFSLFLPFLGLFFKSSINFINFNAKDMELCSYINSK